MNCILLQPQLTSSCLPARKLYKTLTLFSYLCSLCSSNWQSRQVNLSHVSQYSFSCSFLWKGQNTGRWLVTPTASIDYRKMSVQTLEIVIDLHYHVFPYYAPHLYANQKLLMFLQEPSLNGLEVSVLEVNTNEYRKHHHILKMIPVLLCNVTRRKNTFLMTWAVYWVCEDYTACNDTAALSSLQTKKATFLYPYICLS